MLNVWYSFLFLFSPWLILCCLFVNLSTYINACLCWYLKHEETHLLIPQVQCNFIKSIYSITVLENRALISISNWQLWPGVTKQMKNWANNIWVLCNRMTLISRLMIHSAKACSSIQYLKVTSYCTACILCTVVITITMWDARMFCLLCTFTFETVHDT